MDNMKNLILFIAMAFILSLSCVSAGFLPIINEKADLKQYIEISPTADIYPAIEVKDWWGLGAVKADMVLTEHTETCGANCMSQFEITTYSDSALVDNIKFLRELDNGAWVDGNVRSYQFYIRTGHKEKEVEDYSWVCVDNGIISKNGTKEQDCSYKVIGSHTEYDDSWETYNIGDVLPSGTYVVKLEGQKRAEWTYDWIMTSQGKEISEWSTWGSSSEIRIQNATQTPDAALVSTSTNWFAQSFYNATPIKLTRIEVSLSCSGGSPGAANMNIFNYSGGKASGSSWATSSVGGINCAGQFLYNFTFNNLSLPAGRYAFSISTNSSSGATNIQNGYYNAVDLLPNENVSFSADSGSSWATDTTKDMVHSIYAIFGSVATLDYPSNNYVSSTTGVLFNTTIQVAGGATITNASLYIDGALNETKILTGTQNTTTFTKTLSDGQHNWTVRGCDSDGACGWASNNYTLTIDSTKPTINVIFPKGTISGLTNGQNVSLNYSISDTNINTCWYVYNNVNYSLDCSKNSTFVYSSGVNSLTLYANDTAGNMESNTTNWILQSLFNNIVYNTASYELSNENFLANLTFGAGYTGSYGYLYYQGVPYLSTLSTSGTNTYFSNNIQIPLTNGSSNNSFYYSIIYTNGTDNFNINSSLYNQTINPIYLIACNGTYNQVALNFTIKEEATFYLLNSSLSASFNYWSNSSTGIITKNSLYQNLTSNYSNYQFCIFPQFAFLKLSGVVEYSKTGYDPRTYWFNNADVNNITQNINLYLAATNATDIMTFNVIDERDNNIVGAYIYLQRWDIGTGNFYTVDIAQTDNNGRAVMNMRLNDAYYRQVVVYNDKVYLTTVPAIETSTSKILRIYLTVVNPYQYFQNVAYNLSFNNNTNYFTLTYTDTTGGVAQGCLYIYKNSVYNSTRLWYDCINTASGSISYYINTSVYGNGTYIAQAITTLISNYSSVTQVLDTLSVNLGGNTAWKTIGSGGKVASVIGIGTGAMIGVAAGNPFLGFFLVVAIAIGCSKIGFLNLTETFLWSIASIIIIIILTAMRRR